MSKFSVDQCRSYKVVDEKGNFLHSDGSVLSRGEYFPTEEQAQAVLDKFQPDPPSRVWVHGDVFENAVGKWIYLKKVLGAPYIVHLDDNNRGGGAVDLHTENATFLFNIKDALSDRGLV